MGPIMEVHEGSHGTYGALCIIGELCEERGVRVGRSAGRASYAQRGALGA